MRKGFTLVEVTLAMMIMAGGILAVVGLYAYGFREAEQSREDVVSAAFADAVLSPLVAALSSKEMKWDDFKQLGNYPNSGSANYGWWEYFDKGKGEISASTKNKASDVFDLALKDCNNGLSKRIDESYPKNELKDAGLTGALVFLHQKDSPVVSIGFRVVKTESWKHLMASPMYFTEVRFQGKQTNATD